MPLRVSVPSSDRLHVTLSPQLPLASTAAAGALAVTLTFWLGHRFQRRLGGYTGDCIGAVQQVAEVAVYVGVVAGTPL